MTTLDAAHARVVAATRRGTSAVGLDLRRNLATGALYASAEELQRPGAGARAKAETLARIWRLTSTLAALYDVDLCAAVGAEIESAPGLGEKIDAELYDWKRP